MKRFSVSNSKPNPADTNETAVTRKLPLTQFPKRITAFWYYSKFKLVNSWVEMQIKNHPDELWEDGVNIGDVIRQVSKFKYLGLVVQNDAKINEDITHMIKVEWFKWRKILRVVCDHKKQHEKKVAKMIMLGWMCSHTERIGYKMIERFCNVVNWLKPNATKGDNFPASAAAAFAGKKLLLEKINNKSKFKAVPYTLSETYVSVYLLSDPADRDVWKKIKVGANCLLNAKRVLARLSKCQILRSLFEIRDGHQTAVRNSVAFFESALLSSLKKLVCVYPSIYEVKQRSIAGDLV
ncbi:hypothetical protein CR513_14172, partial [Mucuna pruriens]